MLAMEDSNPDFNSINHDPEHLQRLRKRYVKVQLKKETHFVGFVRSIDPISHSIILLVPKGDTFQTTLIPGHAILDVAELLTELDPPSFPNKYFSEEKDMEERKTRLIKWFKVNLLPTSEVENKIVVASVNILPPYSTMDIYANNPVIVSKIKKLMQQMPDSLS